MAKYDQIGLCIEDRNGTLAHPLIKERIMRPKHEQEMLDSLNERIEQVRKRLYRAVFRSKLLNLIS